MFSAQSLGETIGAAPDHGALCARETYRARCRILIAAAALLVTLTGFAALPYDPAFADPVPDHSSLEQPQVDTLIEDGVGRYREGEPAQALEIFLRAAQADPEASLPWIWAGIAATAAGKMQDADTYFKQGLAQPHTSLQDRIVRGWLARLTVFTPPPPAPARPPATPGTPQVIAALARSINPHLTAAQADWLGERLVAAAREQHVDPWLVAAVVYVESRFNQASVSSRGAMGLGQLMPHTARAAGVNPRDTWGNLVGTAMTLGSCIREFGDLRLALAAYNAGPKAVYRYRGVPPFAETRWYVTAVLEIYRRIRPG
jgi:tetratricopeptide (TPR) repeat protein